MRCKKVPEIMGAKRTRNKAVLIHLSHPISHLHFQPGIRKLRKRFSLAFKDLEIFQNRLAAWNLDGIIDNVEPIPVCTLKGYGEIPAADIIERLGITDQNDEKLHEATNELYKFLAVLFGKALVPRNGFIIE